MQNVRFFDTFSLETHRHVDFPDAGLTNISRGQPGRNSKVPRNLLPKSSYNRIHRRLQAGVS